jgi:hypothetical protein
VKSCGYGNLERWRKGELIKIGETCWSIEWPSPLEKVVKFIRQHGLIMEAGGSWGSKLVGGAEMCQFESNWGT